MKINEIRKVQEYRELGLDAGYIKVNSKHEVEFEFKCGLTAKENL